MINICRAYPAFAGSADVRGSNAPDAGASSATERPVGVIQRKAMSVPAPWATHADQREASLSVCKNEAPASRRGAPGLLLIWSGTSAEKDQRSL